MYFDESFINEAFFNCLCAMPGMANSTGIPLRVERNDWNDWVQRYRLSFFCLMPIPGVPGQDAALPMTQKRGFGEHWGSC